MRNRMPVTFRATEAVEAALRRHATPRQLRLAYRVGYRVLRPWWFITRPRTRGVKVVVRHGERVLLIRHSYARRDEWDLTGGFVHPDEEPEVALDRELAEELGIAAPVAPTRIAVTPARYDHKREELFTYVVDVDGETLRPSTAEIAEARWFERTALPRRTTRLARRMVARSYWECWSAPPDE